MGKFDMSKLDGIMGISLFGAAMSCFISSMVSNLIAKIPTALPEVVQSALLTAFNTLLTGIIVLVISITLIVSNTIRTKISESEGTPTWHVIMIISVMGMVILLSLLIPQIL